MRAINPLISFYLRLFNLMCPRLLYQAQELGPLERVRWLRIGLVMIVVSGCATRGGHEDWRALGLLWIFGRSLPFFRMQPGRSHNRLTKFLERHLCAVSARRSFL